MTQSGLLEPRHAPFLSTGGMIFYWVRKHDTRTPATTCVIYRTCDSLIDRLLPRPMKSRGDAWRQSAISIAALRIGEPIELQSPAPGACKRWRGIAGQARPAPGSCDSPTPSRSDRPAAEALLADRARIARRKRKARTSPIADWTAAYLAARRRAGSWQPRFWLIQSGQLRPFRSPTSRHRIKIESRACCPCLRKSAPMPRYAKGRSR